MHNTYVNDLMDCAYPFMAGQAYPFPLSLVTGMSLCLYASPDRSSTLGISSIAISRQRIFMVAVYDGRPLGYFDIDLMSGSRDAAFMSYASGMTDTSEVPMAMGHVTIGDVPSDVVSYSGFWRLDPSCVRFMVMGGIDMYSYYSPVYYINGIAHEAGTIFSIDTAGCLDVSYSESIYGDLYSMSLDVDALGSWQVLYDAYTESSPVVEAIGDISIASLGANRTYAAAVDSVVLVNERSDIYMSITRGYDKDCKDSPYLVVLTLTGTRDFPACPGIQPEEDGAYTPGSFYPKEG